ncbi:hypothetical protein [Streptomyces collinus]|uniref:Uncharacterized protein n=1 Tax=Streptomyces collinus TaxID=42684 RepID=A0AA89U1H6_STRCU|nr:hypothetical protein [Streptomyces collinus]MBB5815563.1 hypothetical protein [Streptomyces collinus]WMX68476.1 hypothetical protein RFN52_36090 [Streptomyces collinus]
MTAHDDGRTPAPADERTEVLDTAGEGTRVLGPPGEQTRVLGPAGEQTRVLGPAGEQTRVLGPAGERTRVLNPADGPADSPADSPADGPGDGRAARSAPSDRPGPDDAEYSATVLASHWIQRPGPDETPVGPPAAEQGPARPVPPDRVEGSVLRFGPGVTAAARQRTHLTLPAVPPPPAPRGRRLRRHALPALVLVCVLAFLAWQRLGPPLRVNTVTVTARPAALGCGGTADLVGLVTTNGRPGTLSYRWIRSDGTASGVLKEELVRGQRQARLHLRWTFEGPGHRTARAELRILSGTGRTATTGFAYDCP